MPKKFEYTIDLEILEKIRVDFENLKERKTHPCGDFDKGGRFYLSEKFDCCKGIRTPSRNFPFSEMLHGRSLIHVLHQNGLDESNLTEARKYINSFKPARKIEKHYCYKKVVFCDYSETSFESLFDSKFLWIIGVKSKPEYYNEKVYGFNTIENALDFDISRYKMFDNHKAEKFAILYCETSKPVDEYESGKISYNWIKPISWVLSQKVG